MEKEKIISLIKEYWKYLMAIIVVLCLLFIFLFYPREKKEQALDLETYSQQSSEQSQSSKSSSSSSQIVVDVKGEVKNPSVYTVDSSLRVNDVIEIAGGFTKSADQKSINLAKKITDEQVIYVASIEEGAAIAQTELTSDLESKSSAEKVNINEANLSELQNLTGVGEKRAQDIIDYRTENGPFKSIEDLKNVSGFGEKTVENLKESIRID
ncbi:MAG: helix-hairpin-helix domain-containing protein [Lactovum sp.]